MGELNLDKIERSYSCAKSKADSPGDTCLSAWETLIRNDEIPYMLVERRTGCRRAARNSRSQIEVRL